MLPFLKKRNEGGVAVDPEVIERKPDDESDGYDMLDAVADDLLAAIEKKDAGMVKAALASFAEHLKSADEQQDQQLMEGV